MDVKQIICPVLIAILVFFSVGSPLPLPRNVLGSGECKPTESEVQSMVCLLGDFYDAVRDMPDFTAEGLQSCTVDLSSLHLKYITLQHYLDWMQEIGYPGVMNKSVELLNDVVPTLNTTVERVCTCDGMNCSEGDIPLELGSGLNETALPFCYLNVIDQLSQEIYQSVIPQDMCTVCKRPQNLSSCDVSNLAEDIKNFDIDDIEIPPSMPRSCLTQISRHCSYIYNWNTDATTQLQEHLNILSEVLQNRTKLPALLSESDILDRLDYSLSSMNTSLINVCNEPKCGECATSNSTLTALEQFYVETEQLNCGVALEEMCRFNVLTTFVDFHFFMTREGYFQECTE